MGWKTLADSEERQASEQSGKGWESFTRVVKTPHRRHRLSGFAAKSLVRDQNSLIEPWVDILADMEAINAGLGSYDSATRRVHVNRRTYGVHDNGTAFPISGEGVIQVNRGTYKALLIMRRYNGVNDRSRFEIDINDYISTTDRDDAIRNCR